MNQMTVKFNRESGQKSIRTAAMVALRVWGHPSVCGLGRTYLPGRPRKSILGGRQEPPEALPLLTIALWATPAHGGPSDTTLERKTDPNGETPQPATQVQAIFFQTNQLSTLHYNVYFIYISRLSPGGAGWLVAPPVGGGGYHNQIGYSRIRQFP